MEGYSKSVLRMRCSATIQRGKKSFSTAKRELPQMVANQINDTLHSVALDSARKCYGEKTAGVPVTPQAPVPPQ